MVFKASRKTSRKLKTRVSLLILVCLIMPAASADNNSNVTSVPISSIAMRHCGLMMIAADTKINEVLPQSQNYVKNLSTYKSDIKILKRVRSQLKEARNHFRKNRETIAQLYADVKSVMQTEYHYAWLQSQPMVWYKKHIRKLNKDEKVKKLLPMLRDSLHNFSLTLEKMRQFSEIQFMSNYTIRKQILDELSERLIAVLCEVETALVSLSWWQYEKIPDVNEQTVIVSSPEWEPNPDRTAMLLQDWGVLTVYYRFLKDWIFISRKMVQEQVSTIITRTTVISTTKTNTTNVTTTDRPSPQPCIRHRCGSSKRKRRKSPGHIA